MTADELLLASSDVAAGSTCGCGASSLAEVPLESQGTIVVPPPQQARGASAPAFVYAIGQIDWRFPSLGVEKEFAQAVGDADNAGRSDREVVASVLGQPGFRYLARQICWVLTVGGLETYILAPRDPVDLDLLTGSVRPDYTSDAIDLVIGVRGGIAPPEACNGLALPVVVFDQIYSFDRASLIASVPVPESNKNAAKFRSAAGDLFDDIRQLSDNAGALDEHRALNYLAVRYPRVYASATTRFENNFSFTGVEVRPSQVSEMRRVVDVIFTYTHRQTDVAEKEFVRVDVTEEFPFLVTKLGNYYRR